MKHEYLEKYLPIFKKYYKKNKVFLLLILFLFILNLAQFAFWFNSIKAMEKNILAANVGLSDQKQRIDRMGQYFETKGNITIGALLETVDKLQSDEDKLQTTINTMSVNIDVANSNVSKYNTAVTDIYDKLNILQQQINILRIYLRL